ncbi:MAG: 2-oxoglutarate dehydrogenase complex dihydrolipoyllysine-residue succinyltransferase [Desulfobacterales bacterium]|nr:2-oxoglutarate dehydrogenase complex dihydrolipoyllysine-residue succinyltransferase [Desulfobacterales bacterium]MDX2447890.1 2-oxoglutarate dehydrogenase complex dihydrolipoyllysine-residue succinyltransferase [Desulfobacterales bacterium]
MIVEIKVPSVGESVTEAVLGEWFKNNGDAVKKGDPLFVIETDKVTLEVESEVDGVLKITVTEGETVVIGGVVGTIDTEAPLDEAAAHEVPPVVTETAPDKPEKAPSPELSAPAPAPSLKAADKVILSPAVRRLVSEKGLDVTRISGTGPGSRVTKGDVLLYLEQATAGKPEQLPAVSESRVAEAAPVAEVVGELTSRKSMTPIRQRIAARLLEAKQNTAMLTTFNDIDMSRVMAMRAQYKESFLKKHGVSLGFMSFFIKACVEALKEFPEINAFVDGKEFLYHHYYHIGVAIGTGRGLVVPVVRHCEKLNMAGMERAIVDYVAKIKENRLDLADLEGGTFTITNGGVFGSLLSTPILNTPQSAILGMHRIEKRPVVVDDEIVVRPMMYVALSYDHRIVDGREAVTFLKSIKEFVEKPERSIMEI